MKKGIVILLSMLVLVSAVFAACQRTDNKKDTTTSATEQGLDSVDNEYGIETVEVTDKDGKKVTDKNGKTVTTEVAVKYTVNKKGKTVAVLIDNEGNEVTDKKGNPVTKKTDVELTSSTTKPVETTKATTTKKGQKTTTTTTTTTTATTKGGEQTTSKELTTIEHSKDKVPTISDAQKSKTKVAVTFSGEDQQIVKSMLEVPYLYKASYENADGVPINIAAHAALWMAEREGLNTTSYASGTIVLDLFKYFGQTVVNFKTKCNNEADNGNIAYNANNDTFTIASFEEKQQTVTIKTIEYLGNNNYYLVTADVEGAGSKDKVYAIVQKNRLDATLGFSIKALKWK